ncbi:hypothetical protein CBL_00576 [Carabus blaptoides fortunei]
MVEEMYDGCWSIVRREKSATYEYPFNLWFDVCTAPKRLPMMEQYKGLFKRLKSSFFSETMWKTSRKIACRRREVYKMVDNLEENLKQMTYVRMGCTLQRMGVAEENYINRRREEVEENSDFITF